MLRDGQYLPLCRPVLLKSLVAASSEASFAGRCEILQAAFTDLLDLLKAHQILKVSTYGELLVKCTIERTFQVAALADLVLVKAHILKSALHSALI